jgi:hypothetical protein
MKLVALAQQPQRHDGLAEMRKRCLLVKLQRVEVVAMSSTAMQTDHVLLPHGVHALTSRIRECDRESDRATAGRWREGVVRHTHTDSHVELRR